LTVVRGERKRNRRQKREENPEDNFTLFSLTKGRGGGGQYFAFQVGGGKKKKKKGKGERKASRFRKFEGGKGGGRPQTTIAVNV